MARLSDERYCMSDFEWRAVAALAVSLGEDVDLSYDEINLLRWLAGRDAFVVDNLCSIFRKIRMQEEEAGRKGKMTDFKASCIVFDEGGSKWSYLGYSEYLNYAVIFASTFEGALRIILYSLFCDEVIRIINPYSYY